MLLVTSSIAAAVSSKEAAAVFAFLFNVSTLVNKI